MKRIFEIEYDDSLGEEWLNLDTFKSLLFTGAYLNRPVKINEIVKPKGYFIMVEKSTNIKK